MRFWRNAYRRARKKETSRKSIISSVEQFVPAEGIRDVRK